MRTADWYFDFVSPYAYLQTFRFRDLPTDLDIRLRPVLFAGLLKHWGNIGPAELAPKRIHTYRHVQWLADRMKAPFRLPPVHPFNPLRALRLAVALESDRAAAFAIFRAIWEHGELPDDDGGWRRLCRRVSVDPDDPRIDEPNVRTTLRANGDAAIAAGVFGVPTFVYDGAVFWGLDSTDFFLDVLADPTILQRPAMARAASLPIGVQRRA